MDTIFIRKYEPSDVDGFYTAVLESIPEVSRWLPWCDSSYSRVDTEKWIVQLVPSLWDTKKGFEFIIVQAESGKVAGGCCLEQIDLKAGIASIGYWVRSSEARKGVATQACHFLLDFGFRELALKEILVIPSVDNIPSIRVAEKLPYYQKEVVKDGFQIRDKVSDAMVYRIKPNS